MTSPGSHRGNERGAAVVEFAIVLPLLLVLVFGIIEFGRGYNVKVQLTASVREGARALALGESSSDTKAGMITAAQDLNPDLSPANITTSGCPPSGDGNATVTISYDLPALTPLVPSGSTNITVTGVMRCGL